MFFYVELLLGLPSLLIYVLVIIVLLKRKKEYSASFRRIFLLSFIINIFCFTNTIFSLRLPGITCKKCYLSNFFLNFPLHPFLLSLSSCVGYNFAYCQFFLIFVTCSNRFTAIWWPITHEKIWDKLCYPLIALTIIGPFGFTFEMLEAKTRFLYFWTTDCYVLVSEKADDLSLTGTLLIFEAATVTLTLFVNILSILRLHRLPSLSQNEKAMMKISCVSFLIQVFGCGITTVLMLCQHHILNSSMMISFLTFSMPFTTDVLTLSNGWILFFFDKDCRHNVLSLVGVSVFKRNMVSFVGFSTSNR